MTIRIVDNGTDREGVLIECVEGDRVIWRSWADESIDPAIRLSPDQYPTIADERTTTPETEVSYRVPTVDEYRTLAGIKARDYDDPEPGEAGRDHHRVLATLAAVVEAVPVTDAAAAAKVKPADLVAEAEAWAVAAEVEAVRS
jgi:hypothetical protein